jgi:hypothetical protein
MRSWKTIQLLQLFGALACRLLAIRAARNSRWADRQRDKHRLSYLGDRP